MSTAQAGIRHHHQHRSLLGFALLGNDISQILLIKILLFLFMWAAWISIPESYVRGLSYHRLLFCSLTDAYLPWGYECRMWLQTVFPYAVTLSSLLWQTLGSCSSAVRKHSVHLLICKGCLGRFLLLWVSNIIFALKWNCPYWLSQLSHSHGSDKGFSTFCSKGVTFCHSFYFC